MQNRFNDQQSQTPPPSREEPSKEWEHYKLWKKINNIFEELPQNFKSIISISGIAATEVYTFGAVLGATIEEEVVRTLNNIKHEWDPENKYEKYILVRQPQTFPDLVLKSAQDEQPILGVELKSWYILAKEGEPSLRFVVTPNACAPQDFFVVVPWVLSNVLSGTPIVYKPFVERARYVAQYRNYWWQNIRNAKSDSTINAPANVTPYPRGKVDLINDVPASDSGNNFGRIARIKLNQFDEWVSNFNRISLLGINVQEWRGFFKAQVP